MRIDSSLQKLEIYFVAIVAVVLVAGGSFALSTPFAAENYGVANVSAPAPPTATKGVAAGEESRPALLEPALRSLDGVAYHG